MLMQVMCGDLKHNDATEGEAPPITIKIVIQSQSRLK